MTDVTAELGVRRRPYDSVRAAWQVAAICVGWFAVVVAAGTVPTGPAGHAIAVSVHLLSLAVGFGSVLAVDGYGLAVLFGRRSVTAMLAFAAAADRFIWTGFAGLAASGIALKPDFGSPWTIANLYAVLVVGLNGVYARTVRDRLPALAPGAGLCDLPREWVVRGLMSASVSQAAWWTSILIGSLAS